MDKFHHSSFSIPGSNYLYAGLLAAMLSLVVVYMTATGNSLAVVYILAAVAGIFVVMLAIRYPYEIFIMLTVAVFFISLPARALNTEIPVSTGIEVVVAVMFLISLTVVQPHKGNFFKAPASIGLLLILIYCIIQLFNPEMLSKAGWTFYMRRLATFIMIYVSAYRLLNTEKRIMQFLSVWFFMVVITALYGCYQQVFGLLPFEVRYLSENEHVYRIYFQSGNIRKFSILSDPTQFGLLCAISAIFFFIISLNMKKFSQKIWCWVGLIICIAGMLFSGTRTALIVLPASLLLYGMLTISKRSTLIGLGIVSMALMAFLFVPTDNKVLNRMRSAVNPSDASLQVRDINRNYIQPYIYQHPIGGGVLTSGVLGMRFNKEHVLAGFPPDSGFLQAAIELGWIGYALTLLVYFLMMYQGVHFFFLFSWQEHRKTKILIAAIICSLFGLVVTQYAQVTIGQFPGAYFYYAGLAIILKLREIAEAKNKLSPP